MKKSEEQNEQFYLKEKLKTDVPYSSNTRPRQKLQQLGSQLPYTLTVTPRHELISIYESILAFDPLIRQSVNIMLDALIASLGQIEHPDPEIQDFCRYNISYLAYEQNRDIYQILKSVIKSTLMAGNSVTEYICTLNNNAQILFKDFVTYHPSTIVIRTNKKGRLTEGEPAYEGSPFKSGIYQQLAVSPYDRFQYDRDNLGEKLLNMWKICYLVNEFEYSNYYGNSLLAGCYRWHILKEALVDMQIELLDRFGNPLTVVTMPKVNSGQLGIDPETQQEYEMTAQESLEHQLQTRNPGDGNFLFLPFIDRDLKPDIKALTSGNNLGTMFLDAINYCEQQIIRSILVPNGLIHSTTYGENAVSERQIEIFNRLVKNLYQMFVIPFVNQTFHRLVLFNFTRESASIPPIIPLRKSTRPEERVALMQMVKGLSEIGFINPTNSDDWEMIREIVDLNARYFDKDDLKFIKDVFINPKQKPTSSSNGPVKQSSPGRPSASSSSHSNPRPHTNTKRSTTDTTTKSS